jgi:hypothetical protein
MTWRAHREADLSDQFALLDAVERFIAYYFRSAVPSLPGALKMTTPALWSSILTGIEQTGTISDDEFAAIREELA